MRKILPIIAVSVLLVLAGCSGPATTYSAPPAEVTDGIAEEHNYQHQSTEKFQYNKTLSVNGQDYHIETTNWMTVYNKSETVELGTSNVSTQGVSLFAIISTPSVEFAGQQLNPIASMPTTELLQRVTEQNKNIDINEKVSESTIQHQKTGQSITVKKYDAKYTVSNGMKVNGYVLVSVFQTGDAILVTVGAYPDQLQEQAAIEEMIAHTETVSNSSVGTTNNSTTSSMTAS